MKKLGKFMKEKREAMGLSLRDASKLSRVSHTHVRDIEDGRSIPSFEMVTKFLKAYMVDIEWWYIHKHQKLTGFVALPLNCSSHTMTLIAVLVGKTKTVNSKSLLPNLKLIVS